MQRLENEGMQVRSATDNDVALIFKFIQKKADFDRQVGAFTGRLGVTEDKIRNTLFTNAPFAFALLVEEDGTAIGFALYGFRYSSFAGQPSLWLEDLYVDESHRNKGAGALLMALLAQLAQHRNCTHLGWTADARNIAGVRFYQRLGAEITMQQGDRCFFRWIPPR